MNGLPGTASHPDLVALAAAELGKAAASSPATSVQGALAIEDSAAHCPRRNTVASFPPESAVGAHDLEELTQAVCRGDETAFTRFYDLYSLRLYKYLLVLAKGDEGEAREVLQTVVVKLAKGFRVFNEERRMWGWLRRSARNSYVDLCRARQREQRFVPLEEHKAELVERGDAEHRLSASLHHALEQLTAEDRELMRAAYVDELPLQEIANALGQTYKAVESRLARLRRKLKTNLLNHLRHEECP
ncbi:MAG TPA: sigma-70 family RNA polymerase sigma factor [Verrucomicrobiae bacterium]|nr:sigma-70 family RNA polymerase sigma factor [Verrucomicrobiae bacterium]